MPYRYVITKSSAQGEQITAEVAQCHPVTGDKMHNDAELSKMVQTALAVSEERMAEMNIRLLEAYELSKFFDQVTWQRIVAILDILAGRQSAAQVSARWTSEVEETVELEQGRVAAMNGVREEYAHNRPANDIEGDSEGA